MNVGRQQQCLSMKRRRIILLCLSLTLCVLAIVWSLRSWGMPDQVSWASRGTFWRVRSERGEVSLQRVEHWPAPEPLDWESGPEHVRDRSPCLDIEDTRLHPPVAPTWSAGLVWGTDA